MDEIACRPSEWIREEECTTAEWDSFRHDRARLQHTMEAQHGPPPLDHRQARILLPDHSRSRHGQQTMHAYGARQRDHSPDPMGDFRRPVDRQSEADWAIFQAHPDSELTFDTVSMDPVNACPLQATWTAISRHGQTILREHQQLYQRNPQSLKAHKDDATVDTAQLKVLCNRTPALSLHDVAAAAHHQQDRSGMWHHTLTSGLSIMCDLSHQWGATALTWDSQYTTFVSPDALDLDLGSADFHAALPQVTKQSLILLDEFEPAQQQQILERLQEDKEGSWVLLMAHASRSSATHKALTKCGMEVDEIIPGQKLYTTEHGWANGDLNVANTTTSYSLWAGRGMEFHSDTLDDVLAITAAQQFPWADLSVLTPDGAAY